MAHTYTETDVATMLRTISGAIKIAKPATPMLEEYFRSSMFRVYQPGMTARELVRAI